MLKKILSAILGLFFFLSLTSFASAQTPLPQGGSTFDNAVPIQAGKYILIAETEGGTYQFYTIPLEAGQNLRVEITAASDGYGMATIYDVYKKKLAEDRLIGEVNGVRDIAIKAERKGNYFISIGSDSGESTGNLYQISYETKTPDPNTDAGSGTSLPPSVSDLTNSVSTLSKAQSLRMPLIILLTIVAVVIVAILLLKKKPSEGKKPERKTEENNETKSESGSVFCSKCGAKNSKEAEFCSKCGAKLSK